MIQISVIVVFIGAYLVLGWTTLNLAYMYKLSVASTPMTVVFLWPVVIVRLLGKWIGGN